jgi:hypothetical protein
LRTSAFSWKVSSFNMHSATTDRRFCSCLRWLPEVSGQTCSFFYN